MKVKNKAIIENMRDAGCSEESIKEFLKQRASNNAVGQKRLLATERKKLLDDIHTFHKRLECLDYLIHKVDKQGA